MQLNKAKRIYFIGIGGIGISGLAKICHWQKKEVTGSDLVSSEITEELKKMGIRVIIGQQAENVPKDFDLYIYSDAVPDDNPERQEVKRLKKSEISYYGALGELMKDYEYSITISGTHGKTTTTAMMALVMIKAGLDPTVVIGSKIKQLGSNARLGKNKKFIVLEACEHREHMMKLSPHAIILTNIEEDHLDYYRDLDHIEMAFQNFINKISLGGVLIKNEDDAESRNLGSDRTIITYGIDNEAEVTTQEIKIANQRQKFKVGSTLFELQIPGRFNVYNALAVIALARHLKIKDEIIKATLAEFIGTWRRFEVLGDYRGATVISDYAHHPTAVRSVLKAAGEFFPGRRLVVVFQPHQRNRTKKLFKGFTECFDNVDFLVLQEIYDVIGREKIEDQNISSRDLVKEIERRGKYVFYSPNSKRTRELIDEHLEKNDLLLILGAGDIYLLANELCGRK